MMSSKSTMRDTEINNVVDSSSRAVLLGASSSTMLLAHLWICHLRVDYVVVSGRFDSRLPVHSARLARKAVCRVFGFFWLVG